MKLSLLVLSLAVIYGTCIIYAAEVKDVDSTEDVTNSDEKYISDYQYEPLQTSLSRQKRSVLLSPVNIIMKVFGKGAGLIFKRIFKSYLILIGLKECSKLEDISSGNENFIKKLFETVDNVLCKVLDMIGSQGRALLAKVAKMAIQFGKKVLIPGLHTFLNKLKDTGYLPPSIVALINMFNVAYKFMKLVGYL